MSKKTITVVLSEAELYDMVYALTLLREERGQQVQDKFKEFLPEHQEDAVKDWEAAIKLENRFKRLSEVFLGIEHHDQD